MTARPGCLKSSFFARAAVPLLPMLAITAQAARPLDPTAGPVALRSLADLRPGPRHARNLCALVLRRSPER